MPPVRSQEVRYYEHGDRVWSALGFGRISLRLASDFQNLRLVYVAVPPIILPEQASQRYVSIHHRQTALVEALVSAAAELEGLREPFFSTCLARYDAGAELARRASALSLSPLKKVFKALAEKSDKLTFSSVFETSETFTVAVEEAHDGPNRSP